MENEREKPYELNGDEQSAWSRLDWQVMLLLRKMEKKSESPKALAELRAVRDSLEEPGAGTVMRSPAALGRERD